jgi:hypothetical protein
MVEPDRPLQKLSRTLLLLLVVLSAFLVVRGYRFGVSDQNEYLPQLYRMLDPGFLRNDWFTNETASFNPRTIFITFLAGGTWLVGDATAHFLVYTVCFGALALGAIRLGARLFGSATAGVIGLVFILLGPQATLGGQDLLGDYLQQSMLSATAIVWALAMFVERRWWLAWLLAGLATALHVTSGAIGAILLGVLTLVQLRRIGLKNLALSAAVFLVPALAAVVPLLVSLRSHGAGLSDAQFIDILGRIRAPWHYLPSQFPLESYVHFGLLLVAAGAALRLQPRSPYRTETFALAATIAALCVVAYVFVELVPIAAVMSLDLTRATVFFRLLAMLALGGAVATGLRRREPAHVLPACAIAFGLVTHADIVVAVVALLWLAAQGRPRLGRGVAAFSALLAAAAVCLAVVTILRPSWGGAVAGALRSGYVHVGVGSMLAAVALGLYALWLHGPALWQTRMRRLAPLLWLVPAMIALLEVYDKPLAARLPGIHDLTVARLKPALAYETELDQLAAWCSDWTPADAVFIIPPGSTKHAMQDFRVKAKRAIVADFKAIAFTREGLRQWRERIRDLTNDAPFADGGDRDEELSRGYASLTADDVRRLADKYRASYILVEKPKQLPFELVHETVAFRLYKAP